MIIGLSPIEQAALEMAGRGCTIHEIASALRMDWETAMDVLQRARRVTAVNNRMVLTPGADVAPVVADLHTRGRH